MILCETWRPISEARLSASARPNVLGLFHGLQYNFQPIPPSRKHLPGQSLVSQPLPFAFILDEKHPGELFFDTPWQGALLASGFTCENWTPFRGAGGVGCLAAGIVVVSASLPLGICTGRSTRSPCEAIHSEAFSLEFIDAAFFDRIGVFRKAGCFLDFGVFGIP